MKEPLSLLSDLLADAKKAGADAADAVLYESSSLSVSQRMGKPEGLERAESRGLSLRVFLNERSAVASSSDTGPHTLREMVTRAVAMAKLAPPDPLATLAPANLLAKSPSRLDLLDEREPRPEWLQEQVAKAEEAALATQGITNSEGAEASFSTTRFCLATSGGFSNGYGASRTSLSVSVLAGQGTGMERDYDYTSARFLSDLQPADSVGKSAAERALARLHPRKTLSAQVPVVFEPRMGRNLLHSFAGAINGSAVARGTSFLKDKMGEKIFHDSITITDEPLRKRGLGSRPFDGEGLACRTLPVIEEGVLKSWLLDVRSAAKLGLAPTGHAGRGLSAPPSPSTSNFTMLAGKATSAALMKDIKSGFYVTELFGMGINLVTGDYSQGAAGFWIENGHIAFPVSEITIAGKLQDMFLNLTAANDLEYRYATNAPTFRIEGMTVAGK